MIVSSVCRFYEGKAFVDTGWLKPGAFATIGDLALPWVPNSLPAFDAVFVDSIAQERASPTKLLPPGLVTGDLAGLLDGSTRVPSVPSARRAFVFRGSAIGDFALTQLPWGAGAGSNSRTAGHMVASPVPDGRQMVITTLPVALRWRSKSIPLAT